MKLANLRSLRVRLTLWYSAGLILVALILAGASRWALDISLDHALDQSLRYRLIGLHDFIEENSQGGMNSLTGKLREMSSLGELFQVFGPKGELLAQSKGLARHEVSTQAPPDPGARMIFRNEGPEWFPVRMATQRIYADGQPLIIEVADPRRKFDGVLKEFYSILFGTLPIPLGLAVLGGLWLSRRALAPVDQIIEEARSIDPSNLAARLSVRTSGDELQRLPETLNQMLSRVEQSVLRVRRFTADASHELRAPMTLIYTAAQFALRRDRSHGELKEAIEKILREAQRCTELINQLLLLARSDVESTGLALAPTELSALALNVAGEMTMLASEKGLTLSTRLPERPVRAAVEENSFRRMLLILLDNAVKYTPAGGSITLSVIENEASVAVAVEDTGSGITEEQLPLVFDRFWRADKVRSRDAGGTGLGLAIAREIAQGHGAELDVKSCAGRGSTFTVILRRSQVLRKI